MLDVAPSLIPQGLLAGTLTLEFNRRVAVFCAVAALAVGLVFGVAPAWQATKVSADAGHRRRWPQRHPARRKVRGLLVSGQVAIAVVLLFGAGLLLRTPAAVDSVDRGYGEDQVLTMMVDPLYSRYPSYDALPAVFSDVEQEVDGDSRRAERRMGEHAAARRVNDRQGSV